MSNRCPKCVHVHTHIVDQHVFLLLSVNPLSRLDAFYPPASHCFLGTDSQIPGPEMKRSEERTRDYSPPPSPSPCAPHKDFVGRVRQRLYRKLILSRQVRNNGIGMGGGDMADSAADGGKINKETANAANREVFNSLVSHLNLRFRVEICRNC